MSNLGYFQTSLKDPLLSVSLFCHLASIILCALILSETLALYKSFTYLLTYLAFLAEQAPTHNRALDARDARQQRDIFFGCGARHLCGWLRHSVQRDILWLIWASFQIQKPYRRIFR